MTIGQDDFSDLTLDESLTKTNSKIIGDDFKIIEPTDSEKNSP